MLFKKITLALVSCFSSGILYAQLYQKPNERLILSFTTAKEVTISVCADTSLTYMVFRKGTKDHIDYEFPTDTIGSFKKFKWMVNTSGQGFPFDEATAKKAKPSDYYPDKYYKLAFKDGNKRYMVYQYAKAKYMSAINEKSVINISVFVDDVITKKQTEYKAILATRKGSLRLLMSLPGLEQIDHDFLSNKDY